MQVVQVDSDVQHFRIDQPVEDGWVGTVAPILVQGPPGDYVVVPAENVIELIEEREDGTARFDPTWHGDVRRFVSDWKPVDGD